MRGLIARLLAGRAPSPAAPTLDDELTAAIAQRRADRCARPASTEAKRFAHARAKVDQLRAECAVYPARIAGQRVVG